MGKIVINLLPPELAIVEKQKSKKILVVKITSLFIVFVIIITSLALGFSVVKTGEEQQKLQDLENARAQVASFNNQEGYLTLIKQKLAKITNLKETDSKRINALNLIINLIPNGISISSLSVDKAGQILLNGNSDGIESLDNFFTALTDDKKNGSKINKVIVDNLNRSGNEQYRFDLAISLK